MHNGTHGTLCAPCSANTYMEFTLLVDTFQTDERALSVSVAKVSFSWPTAFTL